MSRKNRFRLKPEVVQALTGALVGYYTDDDMDTVRLTVLTDDSHVVLDVPVELLTEVPR